MPLQRGHLATVSVFRYGNRKITKSRRWQNKEGFPKGPLFCAFENTNDKNTKTPGSVTQTQVCYHDIYFFSCVVLSSGFWLVSLCCWWLLQLSAQSSLVSAILCPEWALQEASSSILSICLEGRFWINQMLGQVIKQNILVSSTSSVRS